MSVLAHIFSEFVDLDKPNEHEEKEYPQQIKNYSELSDNFLEQLNDEQKRQFLNVEAQRNRLAAMDDEHMFCYGFRIGVQVILEALYPQR